MSNRDEISKKLLMIGNCILDLRLEHKINSGLLNKYVLNCLNDEIGFTYKNLDNTDFQILQDEVQKQLKDEKCIKFNQLLTNEDDGA